MKLTDLSNDGHGHDQFCGFVAGFKTDTFLYFLCFMFAQDLLSCSDDFGVVPSFLVSCLTFCSLKLDTFYL